MKNDQKTRLEGLRAGLHLPKGPRRAPWSRLVPPGELPRRAVMIRLILALGLAAVLWIGVSAAQDPVMTVTYPSVQVTVESPKGYYPVQGPPPVTIVVRGLASDMRGAPRPLAFAYPKAIFPMTTQSVPVVVKNVPPRAEVVSIDPKHVTLQLEQQASRTLKVDVQVTNGPPIGYEAGSPVVSPSTVTVTGPSHTINSIKEARVFLDESGYTTTQTKERQVRVYDNNGQLVSRRIILIKPSAVKVRVPVHIQPHRGRLPVEATIVGTVAPGYRISNIQVIPQLVEVLSNSTVPSTTTLQTVPISVSGLTNSATIPVALVQPPGLTLVKQTQEIVTISVSPIPGSAVTVAGIQIVHKRPGTTVALSNTSVTVAFKGPIPALGATPLAVLDLNNRPPGVYHLTPQIELPHDLSVVSVTPSTIQVRITAPPQAHVVVPTATTTPASTPRPTATARPTSTPRPARTTPAAVAGPPFRGLPVR